MASHDRYFVDSLATKVREVAGRALRVFLGNYTAYRERRVAAGGVSASTSGSSGRAVGAVTRPAPPADDAAGRATAPKRTRSGGPQRGPSAEERELAQVEAELARVAARRAEVEAMLADPTHYGEPGALEALAAEHAELEVTRQRLDTRWAELAEALLEATA